MPTHAHTYNIYGDATPTQHSVAADNFKYAGWGTSYHDTYFESSTAGGSQAHNNIQPNIVMNYIISY